MKEPAIIIVNGRVITPEGILTGAAVLIEGRVIRSVGGESLKVGEDVRFIDAGGNYVSPGFIDIHVHGGGGYDFMDGTEEAFIRIAATHARYGTTAMLPTTLTSSKEEILETLAVYERAALRNDSGACFLGMHLEGPYFAMSQRGAQDPRFIRDPDPSEYEEILAKSSCIRRWSAAPELKGAIRFGEYVKEKGILPAIAHTDAIYEEVELAFEAGYTLATHLYSGMSGVTRRHAYRYAGVIESAFILDGMDVEIIADGIHLPGPLLKLVMKIKGADRTALITDAMRAAGMPEGESVLGNIDTGIKVIVEDGVAKLPDRNSFAGSVATADRLIRTMMSMAGQSLYDSVKMMTATPARIMGIGRRKGSIEVGKDADLVIFDEAIAIKLTMVEGRIIHSVL